MSFRLLADGGRGVVLRRGHQRRVVVTQWSIREGEAATGRVTFTDGSCTYRQTFTDISGEIAGTLTIDGTALDESGFADKSTFKVSVSCR